MLPHLLSLPVFALTLISASAQSLPLDATGQTSLQPSSRELVLPCTRCAFEAKCSDTPHGTNSDSSSYLTITFSVENNALLANQHVVFPPSLPMEFSAPLHNASSSHDDFVTVSYVLDARPIPVPILGRKTNTGEVYLLKMKLLDSAGTLASDQMVLVGVISSIDGSGSLGITEVNTAPIHAHHRPPSNTPIKAWFMAITSSAKEYIRVLAIPSSNHPHQQQQQQQSKPRPKHNNDNTLSSDSKANADPHRTVDHRSHHAWHGHGHAHSLNRDFGRLVRPVLVPALLGAGTGIVVCVMGFLIGRVVVMVYYCMRGEEARKKQRRRRRRRSVMVPVVMVQGYDCEDVYEYGYDLGEREMLLRGKVEDEER